MGSLHAYHATKSCVSFLALYHSRKIWNQNFLFLLIPCYAACQLLSVVSCELWIRVIFSGFPAKQSQVVWTFRNYEISQFFSSRRHPVFDSKYGRNYGSSTRYDYH